MKRKGPRWAAALALSWLSIQGPWASFPEEIVGRTSRDLDRAQIL